MEKKIIDNSNNSLVDTNFKTGEYPLQVFIFGLKESYEFNYNGNLSTLVITPLLELCV
jgi:hypothetical protein